MNKNMIIFILGSLAAILGWQVMMNKFYPQPTPTAIAQAKKAEEAKQAAPQAGSAMAAAPATSTGAPAKAAGASLKPGTEQTVRVSTKAYEATLSTLGARFNGLKLLGVSAHNVSNVGQVLDLIPSSDYPRFATLQFPGIDLAGVQWTLQTPKAVLEGGKHTVRFATKVAGLPLELIKTYQFDPEKPQFDLKITLKNTGAQLINVPTLSLDWGPNLGGESAGIGQFPPAAVVQLEGKIEREKANDDTNIHTRKLEIKNFFCACT
jgi:YidC/Oxa1 family membrane protein insertase